MQVIFSQVAALQTDFRRLVFKVKTTVNKDVYLVFIYYIYTVIFSTIYIYIVEAITKEKYIHTYIVCVL